MFIFIYRAACALDIEISMLTSSVPLWRKNVIVPTLRSRSQCSKRADSFAFRTAALGPFALARKLWSALLLLLRILCEDGRFSLVSSAKYQSSGAPALLRTSNTSRHESPVSIFEDANGFSGEQGYQDRSQHNQPCHKVQAPKVSCCALEAPTNTNQLAKH